MTFFLRRSLRLACGVVLATTCLVLPSHAADPSEVLPGKQGQSRGAIAPKMLLAQQTVQNTKPVLRTLLPDGSLVEYCRDVRINTIVVPGFCTLIVQARASYLQGQFNQAVTLYSRVLEKYPNYDRGYYNRGIAYLSLGNSQAARNDFRQAAALFRRQGDIINHRKALELSKTV